MNNFVRASLVVLALIVPSTSALVAQGALASLGLTEATARTFLFDEIKTPALNRTSSIAIAGTRAFLSLPPAARGAAAAALFAWAKTYVNSAAFTTAYANYRRATGADQSASTLTIDEQVQKQLDDELARLQKMRQEAASLPREAAAALLESVAALEKNLRAPETAAAYRAEAELSRANQRVREDATTLRLPTDPQKLFARRLQEFLDATADADFAAKTVSLTGGPDGIEFIDPADRKKSWVWQEAVIVGPEATRAARSAAEAWLKEIE